MSISDFDVPALGSGTSLYYVNGIKRRVDPLRIPLFIIIDRFLQVYFDNIGDRDHRFASRAVVGLILKKVFR